MLKVGRNSICVEKQVLYAIMQGQKAKRQKKSKGKKECGSESGKAVREEWGKGKERESLGSAFARLKGLAAKGQKEQVLEPFPDCGFLALRRCPASCHLQHDNGARDKHSPAPSELHPKG